MKFATCFSLLAAAFLAAPAYSQTPGFSTVVEFTGTTGAYLGSEPITALMEHSDGNLYGTTLSGGAGNYGTIFKLTKAGVFTHLKALTGATGLAVGFYPWCTLAENTDGFLYGANQGNGSGVTAAGFGNTFKISTSGTYTSFFAFSGQGQPNRGQNPRGGYLRVGSDFYGTTVVGGTTTNFGTVFKTSASGFNTYLQDFSYTGASNRGAQPNARLMNGGDGFLYGSAYAGGSGEFGTLFKINIATGVLTTLLEFTGNASPYPGKYPASALILATDGNLYGTTANGGITRDIGGVLYNAGTVFRYNPSTNAFATLMEFTGGTGTAQGAGPFGGVVQGPDGFLYGVTQFLGPGTSGKGTIYRVSLTGAITPRLVDFTGAVGPHKGEQPYGGLLKTTQGILYGTTLYGGTSDRGTIWKLDTALLPQPPTVTTSAAGSITGAGATLNGVVNPKSLATTWQFEYGTTTAYGTSVPIPGGNLAAGAADQPVSTALTGLLANTLYHFRLKASSTAGINTGLDATFTTGAGSAQAPIVVTGSPTGSTGSTAIINGTVNPQGNAATWQFEYGISASYGSTAPAIAGTTGSGSAAESVSTTLTGLPAGTVIHYRLKATNTAGTTFGSDATVSTTGSPQPPQVVTGAASDITGTSAVLNATVNPRGSATTWRFQYGPDVAFGSFIPLTAEDIGNGITAQPVSISLTGLVPGTTVFYRIIAENGAGVVIGSNGSFTSATPPVVVTQSAVGISTSGATVTGTVNPNGNAATWQFEYGPDNTYGALAPTLPGNTGTGASPESVSFSLTGLAPGTVIHYRLKASNGAGTGYGNDFTFTVKQPPTVVTGPVQNLTATGITLTGSVNPNGIATTWQFAYGTTTAYGSTAPAVAGSAGSSSAAMNVSTPLSGLLPNTTYHFRLNATSANGTTNGPDTTFTTNNNVNGWRQQNFGTMSNTGTAANDYDYDGDGIVNLAEYAFGLNPKVPDRHLLPLPSYNGSTMIASFTTPAGIYDIIYAAEVSTNLQNWSPIANSGGANLHTFVSPITPGGKNWMRLRVTLIP